MRWMRMTVAAVLTVTAMGGLASAQSLPDFGQADGWQVKQVDDEACVLMRYLGGTEDSTLVFYRFEPGEAVEMNVSTLREMAVPDPDAVDWDHLQPVAIEYALSSGGAFGPSQRVEGEVGHEYVSSTRVRQILTIDLDAAALDRIAAAEEIGIASSPEHAARFALGRATRAVAIARRCERQLRR